MQPGNLLANTIYDHLREPRAFCSTVQQVGARKHECAMGSLIFPHNEPLRPFTVTSALPSFTSHFSVSAQRRICGHAYSRILTQDAHQEESCGSQKQFLNWGGGLLCLISATPAFAYQSQSVKKEDTTEFDHHRTAARPGFCQVGDRNRSDCLN